MTFDIAISNSILRMTKTGVCMASFPRMNLNLTHRMFNESRRSSTSHCSSSMVQARMILFKARLAIVGSVRRWLRCPQRMVWWRGFVSLSVVVYFFTVHPVDVDWYDSVTRKSGYMVSFSSVTPNGWWSSSTSKSLTTH